MRVISPAVYAAEKQPVRAGCAAGEIKSMMNWLCAQRRPRRSQQSIAIGVQPGGSPRRGGSLRRLQLEAGMLDYMLLRSKRRTIGFLISDSGLRVTAPRWVTLRDIELAIRGKESWIVAKLRTAPGTRQRSAAHPQMEWRDGAALPYLGGELTLRLHAAPVAAIHHHADQQRAGGAPAWPTRRKQQLKEMVKHWLQRQARRLFAERLPLYAEQPGRAVPGLHADPRPAPSGVPARRTA